MKTTTKVLQPAREINIHKCTCDKCHAPSGEAECISPKIRTVIIRCDEGESRVDGGNSMLTTIDCCTSCFHRVVVPALLALGFTTRQEYRDW